MNPQAAQQYLRTKVMTASPEQLQLMLFDGLLRYCEQTRTGLEKKNYEQVYLGVTRAQKIITELHCSLRHKDDPKLCGQLASIYNYAYRKLNEAGAEHEIAALDEAVRVMRFQRDTWRMLIQKLNQEKAPNVNAAPGQALSMTG